MPPMHGLVNRAVQSFLRDTYGEALWAEVARTAGLPAGGFEPMLTYDPALTEAMVQAASRHLQRPREALFEDIGTYLVSHPNRERLRRLLRFGGIDFVDFLHSLEDLPDRARLALPDLDLPALALNEAGEDHYALTCEARIPGTGHVAMGLLRAMADDYGALVLLDHRTAASGAEEVSIHLLDRRFAAGRRFDLAAGGA
jgi:hypothetical protein